MVLDVIKFQSDVSFNCQAALNNSLYSGCDVIKKSWNMWVWMMDGWTFI